MERSEPVSQVTPRAFVVANGAISAVVVGFLVWLIYFHQDSAGQAGDSSLPAYNALFNSVSAVLLWQALRAIKAGKRRLHQQLIIGALASSALFLATYVYYHFTHGDTKFPGVGGVRYGYLALLASHVILSIVALPMIISSLFFAATGRFAAHKKLSRYTWACWMYVSVTGVLVYLMLHVIDWA